MIEDWFYKRYNWLVFFKKVICAQIERLVAAEFV